jgi:hypothetical protein
MIDPVLLLLISTLALLIIIIILLYPIVGEEPVLTIVGNTTDTTRTSITVTNQYIVGDPILREPSTIIIYSDGLVFPSHAPIIRNGSYYILTDDVSTHVNGYNSISFKHSTRW